jgi:hypothetical protein
MPCYLLHNLRNASPILPLLIQVACSLSFTGEHCVLIFVNQKSRCNNNNNNTEKMSKFFTLCIHFLTLLKLIFVSVKVIRSSCLM